MGGICVGVAVGGGVVVVVGDGVAVAVGVILGLVVVEVAVG